MTNVITVTEANFDEQVRALGLEPPVAAGEAV